MDYDLALPECDSKLAKKCVADIVGEWSNFCVVDIKILFGLVVGILFPIRTPAIVWEKG